jgi:hypothetical protein
MPLLRDKTKDCTVGIHTLWDRLLKSKRRRHQRQVVSLCGHSIRRIKKQASVRSELVDVASVSLGPYMLFANFLHGGTKRLGLFYLGAKDAIDSRVKAVDAFSRTANGTTALVTHQTAKTGRTCSRRRRSENPEEIELPVRANRYKSRQQEGDI